MSCFKYCLSLSFVAVLSTWLTQSAAGAPPTPGPATFGSYAKPDGETFFALGLEVQFKAELVRPTDVLILFDTSASQTAIFRDKALSMLDAMLEDLSPNDRVHLMAVDIDPVPMTESFCGPQSPAMKAGLKKLRARTPLGATDMGLALEAAAKLFVNKPEAPRAVIYIGDGMSAANLLSYEALDKLLVPLIERRVPVSGYTVGPRVDNELLGAIANNTGGILFTDFSDKPAKNYGRDFANIAHAEVFWPTQVKYPPQMVEVFPKRPPPLRNDRDTVLLGRGKMEAAFEVSMTVEHDGKTFPLSWQVEPKKPTDDHAYLADLVTRCRVHQGIALPTAGSGGLIEIRRLLDNNVRKLLILARQALATSDNADQAEQLARKGLEIDPTNPEALAIISAVEKLRKSGKSKSSESRLKIDASEKVEPKAEPKPKDKPKPGIKLPEPAIPPK